MSQKQSNCSNVHHQKLASTVCRIHRVPYLSSKSSNALKLPTCWCADAALRLYFTTFTFSDTVCDYVCHVKFYTLLPHSCTWWCLMFLAMCNITHLHHALDKPDQKVRPRCKLYTHQKSNLCFFFFFCANSIICPTEQLHFRAPSNSQLSACIPWEI